jgi:3-keto steroid reductase
MSSLEAGPKYYNPEDWQLINTEHPYECSKYQIDLLSAHFDRLALREPPENKRTRQFVMEPGVTSTTIMDTLAGGWFMTTLRVFAFYLVCRAFFLSTTTGPFALWDLMCLLGNPHSMLVP